MGIEKVDFEVQKL